MSPMLIVNLIPSGRLLISVSRACDRVTRQAESYLMMIGSEDLSASLFQGLM